MAFKLFSRNREKTGTQGCDSQRRDRSARLFLPSDHDFNPAPTIPLDSNPLKRMFQQGRHSVILRKRDRWRSEMDSDEVIRETERELERRMALVPAGNVTLSTTLSAMLASFRRETELT